MLSMSHLLGQVQLVCAQLEDEKVTVRKVRLKPIVGCCNDLFGYNYPTKDLELLAGAVFCLALEQCSISPISYCL